MKKATTVTRTSYLGIGGVLLACTLLTAQTSESEVSAPTGKGLAASIRARMDAVIEQGDRSRAASDALFDASVVEHGTIDPLLAALDEIADSEPASAASRTARWQAASLRRRWGDRADALTLFEKIAEAEPNNAAAWLQVAELQDASGQKDEAIEGYQKVLALSRESDDTALETSLRLRLALLEVDQGGGVARRSSTGTRATTMALLRPTASGTFAVSGAGRTSEGAGTGETRVEASAAESLIAFASAEGRGVEVRNRAAVVLALLGLPKEAIDLYVVEGELSKRFKGDMRRAEWAIAADDLEKAQEYAWVAFESAKIRRDRRYALAVLVEAHRAADTLQALIDRFAAEENLHADARQVWIDLLRETGQIDTALALFRGSAAGEFTVEMRRELLEMCRESGRADTLVEAFRELIREEPGQVEWREGLARHHLERGDRESAISVWDEFADHTESVGQLLLGCDSMRSLGLDELAIAHAKLASDREDGLFAAALFLFDLHRNRGRMTEAEAELDRLHTIAAEDAPERMALSEAFEQIGNKPRAVEVLEALKRARGDDTGEDLEMRLSWLHSEVGEEEKAMEGWMRLWERIDSVPRRRYVEDRLMTTASRLGRLADIAIELEEKLNAGNADARESGLLVRLYSKVGDPVSASEVIQEYMKHSGGNEISALQEKARVYIQCTDYHNYEKTVEQLIRLDPEGEADYLRQLAMSSLERGRPHEAREILVRLKELERGSDSAEFEAGVLALAGLRDDAIVAYRRGIAQNPERIESYLLLANLLRDTQQTRRAIGMFQHLALAADKDDLFTIAIDGLLNMRAPAPVLEWARRITYERLTRRHEKMYLYQLISDLSEQVNDSDTMLRSLESSLSIAGERRLPLLRELMDLAAQPGGDSDKRLAFGRRLIGLGELVPPDVYLQLGESFLAARDVTSASKTFAMASEVPDYNAFQSRVALSFEKARFLEEALRVYERILVSQASDVSLMAKVAELHEQLGRDDRASELYRRGIELLLSRRPFSSVKEDERDPNDRFSYYFARNVSDYDQYYERLLEGLLATTGARGPIEDELRSQREKVRADLVRLSADEGAEGAEGDPVPELGLYPRVRDRAGFHRRVAMACGRPELANELDLELLRAFPDDDQLLDELAESRLDWGAVVAARELIETSDRSEIEKQKVRFLVGVLSSDSVPGVLPIPEATRLFLSPLVDGERDGVRTLLQRVDFSTMAEEELQDLPVLFAAAVYLDDPELALTYARHWMRVGIKHKKQYELQRMLREILRRCEKSLPQEQLGSAIDFLVSLTLENEEKGSDLIALFPELQKQSETQLLETEKIVEFIEKYVERSSYGVGPLLALVPAEERVVVMRRIWPKVQPTRRANFIVDIMRAFQEKVTDDFADFLVGTFEGAYDDLDNKDFFGYAISNAIETSRKNSDVVLRIAKIVLEKDPESIETQVAYAVGLSQAGRLEEAKEAAATAFRSALDQKKQDFRVTNSINRLQQTFLPEQVDLFLGILDQIEADDGASPELTNRRLDLIGQTEDRDRLLTSLRTAVEKHPKDTGIRDRLQRELRSLGYRTEALALLEDMVELEPKNKRYRSRLVAFWRSWGNPIRALEVQKIGEEEAKKEAKPEQDHPKAEPVPRPTIQQVKKSIDAEKLDDARLTFRRLWRDFQVETNPRYAFYRGQRVYRWPPTAKRDPKPYFGGLSSFREEESAPVERRDAFEVLAEQPFGESELRRHLRTFDPRSLQSAGSTLSGITIAMERRLGAAESIRELIATIEAGRAGKSEYLLLLSMFEKAPDRIGPEGRTLLSDLAKTVHPLAGDRLRRLARLYAKTGAPEQAAALYRWCGSFATWESIYAPDQRFPPIQAADLIDEIVENLDGDLRESTIDFVLRYGEPAEDSYARDMFEMRVLETWEKILGAEKTVAKCRELCEGATDISKFVKRSSAKIAARLYAETGEIERAVRCMEIAFCNDIRPESSEYYYYYRGWWAPSHADIRGLFPKDPQGFARPGEWFEAAAGSLRQWVEAGRMDGRRCLPLLSILAVRLEEAGKPEAAGAMLTFAEGIAGGLASEQLWIIDVARRLGREESAQALERKLLDELRLNLARVPEVLAAIQASDGVEQAIAKGEALLAYTLPDTVIDKVIELHEIANQPARAEAWRVSKAAAQQAKQILEGEKN